MTEYTCYLERRSCYYGTGKTPGSGGFENQNRRYHLWHYRFGRHCRTCCFYEVAEIVKRPLPFGAVFFCAFLYVLLVTVQSWQQVGDAEQGEHHCSKANRREPCRSLSTPAKPIATMQIDQINQPGDQRPDFLGIPAPPTAPGFFRPYRAGHHQYRKKEIPVSNLDRIDIKLLAYALKDAAD